METELISKKELLARYGISYGALYRWKRKGLIPDDWFIKRSTVTGQETFFPKTLVCERIERILSSKDETLLDDLAKEFSGEDRARETLVVDTSLGEKSFYLSDIKSIYLINKNGVRREVTKEVRGLLLRGKEEQI